MLWELKSCRKEVMIFFFNGGTDYMMDLTSRETFLTQIMLP